MGYANTKYEYTDLNSSIISSTPQATLHRCLSDCLQNDSCLGIMFQRSAGSCKLLSFNNAEQQNWITCTTASGMDILPNNQR